MIGKRKPYKKHLGAFLILNSNGKGVWAPSLIVCDGEYRKKYNERKSGKIGKICEKTDSKPLEVFGISNFLNWNSPNPHVLFRVKGNIRYLNIFNNFRTLQRVYFTEPQRQRICTIYGYTFVLGCMGCNAVC